MAQFADKKRQLYCTKLQPIDQSSGSLQLEFFSAGQVAFMKKIFDISERKQKPDVQYYREADEVLSDECDFVSVWRKIE